MFPLPHQDFDVAAMYTCLSPLHRCLSLKVKMHRSGIRQSNTPPHQHTHALLIVCYYQLISACPEAGRKQPIVGLGPPEVL